MESQSIGSSKKTLDSIDNSYRSHAVSDFSLKVPSNRRVGKGGVAILWHKKLDNKVTPLPIEEDRIIGVQIEIFPAEYIFVLQVYFPCSNYSIAEYRDVLDRLDNYINFYAERGTVIIMGDFNTNLISSKYHRRLTLEAKLCVL